MGPEEEFNLFDHHDSWAAIFKQICSEASQKYDFSQTTSRQLEFRNRNRYRDVNPYDHSRIALKRNEIDYINASLVPVPEAKRAYILAQGPLPHTVSHFWLMVWENNCQAVVMLNRLVEKDQIKCHPYHPADMDVVEEGLYFEDVGLVLTQTSESLVDIHFTIRELQLMDCLTRESRQVYHFHYLAWPDFGVPPSPDSFLEFLLVVRESGSLENPDRPAVVHCSAGIGRSGSFCLVDACLRISEIGHQVDLRKELIKMRKYRMGLIQTPEQLRFSYQAVVEATRRLEIEHHRRSVKKNVNHNMLSQKSDDSCLANSGSEPSATPDSDLEEEETGEKNKSKAANNDSSDSTDELGSSSGEYSNEDGYNDDNDGSIIPNRYKYLEGSLSSRAIPHLGFLSSRIGLEGRESPSRKLWEERNEVDLGTPVILPGKGGGGGGYRRKSSSGSRKKSSGSIGGYGFGGLAANRSGSSFFVEGATIDEGRQKKDDDHRDDDDKSGVEVNDGKFFDSSTNGSSNKYKDGSRIRKKTGDSRNRRGSKLKGSKNEVDNVKFVVGDSRDMNEPRLEDLHDFRLPPPRIIKRKPIGLIKKRNAEQLELMMKRQKESGLFDESRRKKKKRNKIVCTSILVAIIGYLVYRFGGWS